MTDARTLTRPRWCIVVADTRHDPPEVARPNEAASVALPRRIACKWHV
jgi:hypothetical protein